MIFCCDVTDKPGAPSGTRTHTVTILSRLPLPLGYRGKGQNTKEVSQVFCPRNYFPVLAAQVSKNNRGLRIASTLERSRPRKMFQNQPETTRILRSQVGMASPW
jgi:hypothetical protein